MNLGDHHVTSRLHRPKKAPALHFTFEGHMDYADANRAQVPERTLPIRSAHAPSPVPPNERRETLVNQLDWLLLLSYLVPISLPNVSQVPVRLLCLDLQRSASNKPLMIVLMQGCNSHRTYKFYWHQSTSPQTQKRTASSSGCLSNY
ncbi:hypothetical protein BYT27DRAFT_6966684 [Phlegmacium glaucopus]|nr:hypothetical protein BYT27DRAFT_6966684 [Phlegmacium glaucopus]